MGTGTCIKNAAGVPYTLTISSPLQKSPTDKYIGAEISGITLRRSTTLKGQSVSVYEVTNRSADRVFLPRITDKTKFDIPFGHGLWIDQSQKEDISLSGMKLDVIGNVSRTGRRTTETVDVKASAIRMQIEQRAKRTWAERALPQLTTNPVLFKEITQVSSKKKLKELAIKDHPTVEQATKMLEKRPTELNQEKLARAYSSHGRGYY